MIIRTYKQSDISQIALLYYDTVHRVNSKDYTKAQIAAWAPEVYEDSFWRERFEAYTVLVAEQDGIVIGFGELESTGHIDCFYVHHEWQRQGVGNELMADIESMAGRHGAVKLFADVSVTALSFFLSMGFAIVEERERAYRNQTFKQYYMEKPIVPGAHSPASWQD